MLAPSSAYFHPHTPSHNAFFPMPGPSSTGPPPPAAAAASQETSSSSNNESSCTKKRRKPKSTEMTCSVCGDKAPDHIHYGGIACFSCRAFFRRSVPKYSSYFCSSEQSCHISISTRKNCQFCRYKKCLDSGMKPSWVLSEEEKSSRNLIKFVKKRPSPPAEGEAPAVASSMDSSNEDRLSGSSSSCNEEAVSPPPPHPPPPICFTIEESRRVESLLFAQDSTRHSIPMPEFVMKEILRLTVSPELNMSPEGITEIYRVIYSRVAKFATYIEQFEALRSSDKKLLLSKNMDSMAILRSVVTFHPDGSGDLRAQLRNTGSPLYGPVGPHYISVDQVFRSPWAKSPEHSSLFKRAFRALASLDLGEKALLLLQLVTLFSVLELPVSERGKIEGIQEQMGLLCLRYLQHKSYSPRDVLAVFNMLSELRDLSNLLTGPDNSSTSQSSSS